MNHAALLSRILADIRALPVLETEDALYVVSALAAKFPLSDHCPTVETLHDCCIGLEDVLSDQVRESEAADWMAERKQCGNRAELDLHTPRTSGGVPAFITEGATA